MQFSRRSYEDTGKMSLFDALEKTKCELETAYAGFDNVIEPDLIDYYIFEVNAILKRYKFLLKEAENINSLPTDIGFTNTTQLGSSGGDSLYANSPVTSLV